MKKESTKLAPLVLLYIYSSVVYTDSNVERSTRILASQPPNFGLREGGILHVSNGKNKSHCTISSTNWCCRRRLNSIANCWTATTLYKSLTVIVDNSVVDWLIIYSGGLDLLRVKFCFFTSFCAYNFMYLISSPLANNIISAVDFGFIIIFTARRYIDLE